jgi:hypothetical protein
MLELHIDWMVLQMNIYMPLISYHEQPFFKSCNFLAWINFSHLLNGFMHAHPIILLVSVLTQRPYNHLPEFGT